MAVFGLPVFGQRKEIEKQKIQGEEKEMKIIIVGCGKVGATLAEQLSNEGNDIVIVDKDAEKVQDISNACDIMGVVGSGSSHNVQLEAGIREANLLIAVTGSDELNLLCCLIAKKAGNGCQTIARVRNPEYSQEVRFIREELGMAMVINPEQAAASEMARILRFPSAIKIETFANGHIELLQFRIGANSVLNNMRIADMGAKLTAKCWYAPLSAEIRLSFRMEMSCCRSVILCRSWHRRKWRASSLKRSKSRRIRFVIP